jgi:nicotinate-nucleotide adenylyltransferase
MRLGIYGGTFDPVHYGHLVLAEQCREQCALDEVWFVPAGQPPHKLTAPISPAQARVDMLELALAGCPEFRVSLVETAREGPSYTVDTLKHLAEEDSSRELFLLMGADSLADFATWRDPAGILALTTLVVVNRGTPDARELARLAAPFAESPQKRVQFVSMPSIGISASDLRRRVSTGGSIRFLVPRAVAAYIADCRLYTPQ